MSNRHVIAESRDGRLRAVTREWDHNGSASVTVLNMRPGDIRSALLAPSPIGSPCHALTRPTAEETAP